MELVGISYITKDGVRKYTLEVTEPYDSYLQNAETGRYATGKKTDSIYVGAIDCSQLNVGMEIEVIYDRMRTLANGTAYQPIKRIDVIAK